MRNAVTWIVVGGLAALGLAAAFDSLRAEPDRVEIAAEPTTTGPEQAAREQAARQLREAGVSGVLTYSDKECRLHAVSLPGLEPLRAPSYVMCRPATPSRGLVAVDGEVVWAGLGYGFAQVVISREELSRAIGPRLPVRSDAEAGFRAVQAVRLDGDQYIVLADSISEPRERVLAGFEGERARFVQPRSEVREAEFVRPSPLGGYYALLAPDRLVGVFTRDGRTVGVTIDSRPYAVAWSPDERWTALATTRSVYVYRTESLSDVVARIPLAVRDLDWGE
jgi:hypothetical protein